MTYEIILNYATEGLRVDMDADDEELYETLHDDEEFRRLIDELSMRFSEVASRLDKEGD